MNTRFRARLMSRLGRWLGSDPLLCNLAIAGHEVTIRRGSYPNKPDYDYAWQVALAREASVVFNIGANTGQAALNVLLAADIEDLVLVEANPDALAVAAENLIRNHLSSRVRFVPGFASATIGETVEFHVLGTGSAGSIFASHSSSASTRGKSISVSSVTVDGLVQALRLVPDLILVDVEGAEQMVLKGAEHTTRSANPRFLVEMHAVQELGGMKGNAAALLSWCDQLGYEAWYLARCEKLTDAGQMADRGRCHLLLQHSSFEYPEQIKGIPQGSPVALSIDH